MARKIFQIIRKVRSMVLSGKLPDSLEVENLFASCSTLGTRQIVEKIRAVASGEKSKKDLLNLLERIQLLERRYRVTFLAPAGTQNSISAVGDIAFARYRRKQKIGLVMPYQMFAVTSKTQRAKQKGEVKVTVYFHIYPEVKNRRLKKAT